MADITAPELPDEFTMSGITYEILRVKDLKHEDGEECSGLFSSDDNTVELDSAIRGHDKIRLTFLHELSHGVEYHMGASLKDPVQLNAMSRCIFTLIRDNPALIAWIAAPKPTRKPKPSTTESDDANPPA